MILIGGVMGTRVGDLLKQYGDQVEFCSPERCFDEALRNLPRIAQSRRLNLANLISRLELLRVTIDFIAERRYLEHEVEARACIDVHDRNDWHVVATALLLDCPIWTEDYHFFGVGLITWKTAHIERFLASR